MSARTPRCPVAARRADGFTMIEIMVAVAILSAMTALLWGSFSISANAKRKVEQIEERYHQIRVAMHRLAREISMAYLSKNDQPGTTKPRTMFVAQKNHKVDEMLFSGLSHVALRENAKESDQSVIRYYGAPDPDNRSRTNLMRRESRRLMGERDRERPGESGAAYILLENVIALHFQYFDERQNEWRESWNTTNADGQADRLPAKVRIALTLRDENDREITFLSGTRIFMRDPLWFSTGQ